MPHREGDNLMSVCAMVNFMKFFEFSNSRKIQRYEILGKNGNHGIIICGSIKYNTLKCLKVNKTLSNLEK